MRYIDAAIAVITREGKVLITQRKAGDSFGGYWEFPGGKRENGESLHQALARELQEELAVGIEPLHAFDPVVHTHRTTRITLHPFLCKLTQGEPQMIECQAAEWIEPAKLRTYKFPPANESLIEQIIKHLLALG